MSSNTSTSPTMVSCDFEKLNIVTGSLPEDDKNAEINVGYEIKIHDVADNSLLKIVEFVLSLNNANNYFYDIECTSKAVFEFPETMEEEDKINYLSQTGAKQISATIRTSIDGITAHFPYGPANIPDIDVSKKDR